jgi:hypothetical protein
MIVGRARSRKGGLGARWPVGARSSPTAGTASTCSTPPRRGWRADARLCAAGRHRRHREAAKPELVLLLGADEVAADRFAGAFKVYVGHHGDKGAAQADLVLPGAAYAEKHGTYVNIEGRVQRGERAPSRRATRARTGRSSARCPTCSASRCRSTASTSCARR